MNFLGLRSNQTAASEQPIAPEVPPTVPNRVLKQSTTLEGLISEDSSSGITSTSNQNGDTDYGSFASTSKDESPPVDGINHLDVLEDEGWIAIPHKELPEDWSDAPDTGLLRSLDRSFVFPGEQLHVLACLSASTQDTEVITPFKVAEVMTKNGIGLSSNNQNGNTGSGQHPVSENIAEGGPDGQDIDHNSPDRRKNGLHQHTASGESLLKLEHHKRQMETLLQRFCNSHFFVRIAESEEPLWSKKGAPDADENISDASENFKVDGSESSKTARKKHSLSATIDRGNFNSNITGGVARNSVKCCSLSNGEIVVLLQINVGAGALRDPVLEILQFEKYREKGLTAEDGDQFIRAEPDPCRELLRWLLPLDNSISPLARPISPPQLSSSASIRSTSIKPTSTGPSGSQLFSFGNFRSYSMSSLPQSSTPPTPVTAHHSRGSFDVDDRDQFSFQKVIRSDKSRCEKLLSFRGVPLEPQRFSVRCGLEGIYIPGRRWRRKIEIVQPLEICSFATNCNTEDLLCVQIKNICPVHSPDIVVYIDAVTIVYEDASNGGPPLSFPIASIEAGKDHNLPSLGLRRGEEHSFILKPATSQWKISESQSAKSSKSLNVAAGNSSSARRHSSYYADGNHNGSSADQYAVLVSCRSNYTESRLLFKQPTNWRPHIYRDLMISVASEMSKQTIGSIGGAAQLPAQVLTLQASNLTDEDLTLTVLAPASFTSPPSVLSLSSSPSSPMSPYVNISKLTAGVSSDKQINGAQRLSSASVHQHQKGGGGFQSGSLNEPTVPISDILPSVDVGCTHLWLQSRVPLGRVPSKSATTIKLEVLPLTDGIIALDSLQIDVKEKGLTYVPEQSLKINATSSITTGIM